MASRRGYTMTTRAASVAATRERILRAAYELQGRQLAAEIGLEAIAERAAVSVQTVLRHFGSRAALFDATLEFATAAVEEERRAPAGDTAAALRVIVEHYETRGEQALMMLAQESVSDQVRRIAANGKALHRAWVLEVFSPAVQACDASPREELVDLLVVATDVYTWKLLRLDRGLGQQETRRRMRRLVDAVLAAFPSDEKE